MEILTKRLLIRKRLTSDIDDLLEINNDEMVLKYNCMPKFTKQELLDELIKQNDQSGHWSLVLKSTGKVIGAIDIETDHVRYGVASKTLAYELNTDYVGQGLMSEALTGVIEYCFNDLNLDVLTVRIFSDNIRSINLIERLGFIKEGHLMHAVMGYGDIIHNDCLYRMLKTEYYSNRISVNS